MSLDDIDEGVRYVNAPPRPKVRRVPCLPEIGLETDVYTGEYVTVPHHEQPSVLIEYLALAYLPKGCFPWLTRAIGWRHGVASYYAPDSAGYAHNAFRPHTPAQFVNE